jgi:TonB-linked SusC/RagA family outer membrane protein
MKKKRGNPCFRFGSRGNFLKKMKLLVLFFFTGLIVVSASTYSQQVKFNLKVENVTVREVFEKIEENSEFILFYNEDYVDVNRKVNINAKEKNVEYILDAVFKNTKNSYKIYDRQIVILAPGMSTAPPLFTGSGRETDLPVQSEKGRQVQGKVLDGKTNESLIGATVWIKGTTAGTTTDAKGNFTINVDDDNAILVISFIGYVSREERVGNRSAINVALQPSDSEIDEVVIVGYGLQKKESIVGTISQTTNEDLEKAGHVPDLKQALTGQMPGVIVLTSSGETGGTRRGESTSSIYIRGRNTWNGGQALILVDGVERSMDYVDPNEVETISTLKDASATAVFGVKGANGVILITTKRGVQGKAKLSLSYDATAMMISKVPEKLDAYQTLLYKNEVLERDVSLTESLWNYYTPYEVLKHYQLPQTPEDALYYPNIDWNEAAFDKVAWTHRATVSVTGGTSFVKYFGSLSYLHESDMFKKYDNGKGYDPNFDYDRFNFRSNFDFKITGRTKLKVNLAGYFSQKNTNWQGEGSGAKDLLWWSSAYLTPPDAYLPQYEDGRWGWSSKINVAIANPVAGVNNLGIRSTRRVELNSNFELEQDLDFITEGLSASASLAYDNRIISEGGIWDLANGIPTSGGNTAQKELILNENTGLWEEKNIPTLGVNYFDWVQRPWYIAEEVISGANFESTMPIMRRLMYQAKLDYARRFGLHNVGAMGVFKREEYANGNMFKNYREDWVFRATYDYDSRYLLEANGAYNGSEQFGPGYRFDFFPSLALGWYVSNEKFFNLDWMNRLKLRFSIGKVGDDNIGGRWLYMSQLTRGSQARLDANPSKYSPYTQYSESVMGNPDIHWEKALKKNFGTEVGFLNDMFSVNFDYFTEHRTDMLLTGAQRSLPPYWGITPPSANLGEVKSHGYEIELKFSKLTRDNLRYWSSFSYTCAKNKIINMDTPELLDAYQRAEGYKVRQSTTQIRAGGIDKSWDDIFAGVPTETNDLLRVPGYYNLLDYNADGKISSLDVIPFRYSDTPENTYTFFAGAEYKGFSVMLQFYGVSNVSRSIPLQNYYYDSNILFGHVLDAWSYLNPNGDSFLPRYKTAGGNIGDYFLYDGSYLKLQNAEFAYTFSKNDWLKKANISLLKLYINGHNLLYWSDMPDDRESGGGTGVYPLVSRITFGVNVTF